jgi:hypothetical protein
MTLILLHAQPCQRQRKKETDLNKSSVGERLRLRGQIELRECESLRQHIVECTALMKTFDAVKRQSNGWQ